MADRSSASGVWPAQLARQADGEGGAGAERRLDLDGAAQQLDELLDDVEAEADALGVCRHRAGRAAERVEDEGHVAGFDADALVAYAQDDGVVAALARHLDDDRFPG